MRRPQVYREAQSGDRYWFTLVALIFFVWAACARAQEAGSGATPPSDQKTNPTNPPEQTGKVSRSDAKTEVATKDTNTTFKLHVNLVQVRVVVRDENGKPIEHLSREDFQIYDQGKLQVISTFATETPESRRDKAEAAANTQGGEVSEKEKPLVAMPQRFVALVFDDIHLSNSDATFVRVSAKALIESMTPTDRMGIYSTSGEVTQEFTSDKEALERKIMGLTARPMMGKTNSATNCPDVSHYMADRALNKNDPQVFGVVTDEVLQCQFQGDRAMLPAAQTLAQSALTQELAAGDTDNSYVYRHIEDAIRRLGGMPGERIMAFVSPGFLLTTQQLDEMGIIDRATRAGIVINTVDARGLYTPEVGDVTKPRTDNAMTAGYKSTYRTAEQFESQFVLDDFAAGTGGTFFHNSNDLKSGLLRAGAAPEVSYVLGFSPQNQKLDGIYHVLKVKLTGKQKYSIQARKGYYAPKKLNDPQEQAKTEIQEAVFSQDEMKDVPFDLQTQYFKSDQPGAHLSVVSHIDVKGLHFRKAEGRNWDELIVATVIFDENGNYVAGGEKILEMRLLDKTYERLSHTGLTMKSSFDVKPGKYVVRQVIRDSEGAQMAAKNGSVVIPF
jgi:VWFA-related protein